MTIKEDTILRVHLGIAVTTLFSVLALAWQASAMATRLEVLWAEYVQRHSLVSSINPQQEQKP